MYGGFPLYSNPSNRYGKIWPNNIVNGMNSICIDSFEKISCKQLLVIFIVNIFGKGIELFHNIVFMHSTKFFNINVDSMMWYEQW